MDYRPQLLDLLNYTGRMATLAERGVYRLADYRTPVIHEQDLRNRVGIYHDVADADEPTWLRIDRLPRHSPPPVPEDLKSWITVGRDPSKLPTIHLTRVVTVKGAEADALVARGVAKQADVAHAMQGRDGTDAVELRDVVLRLENDQQAEQAVRAYLSGPWTAWAETRADRTSRGGDRRATRGGPDA